MDETGSKEEWFKYFKFHRFVQFFFDLLWVQTGPYLRKSDYPRLMAVMVIDGKIGIFMWASILVLFPIKNLCISFKIFDFHRGFPGS